VKIKAVRSSETSVNLNLTAWKTALFTVTAIRTSNPALLLCSWIRRSRSKSDVSVRRISQATGWYLFAACFFWFIAWLTLDPENGGDTLLRNVWLSHCFTNQKTKLFLFLFNPKLQRLSPVGALSLSYGLANVRELQGWKVRGLTRFI
jgi:hypothetical protein